MVLPLHVASDGPDRHPPPPWIFLLNRISVKPLQACFIGSSEQLLCVLFLTTNSCPADGRSVFVFAGSSSFAPSSVFRVRISTARLTIATYGLFPLTSQLRRVKCCRHDGDMNSYRNGLSSELIFNVWRLTSYRYHSAYMILYIMYLMLEYIAAIFTTCIILDQVYMLFCFSFRILLPCYSSDVATG